MFGNSINILDRQTFNIDHFRKALCHAFQNYFADVGNNSITANNFNIRFDYSNILEDGALPTLRNFDRELVRNFEELDNLAGFDFKIAMAAQIEIKK